MDSENTTQRYWKGGKKKMIVWLSPEIYKDLQDVSFKLDRNISRFLSEITEVSIVQAKQLAEAEQ